MKEEILKELLEIIKSTKDFTLEQAPLYAQELLEYGTFDLYVDIAIASIFLLAGIVFILIHTLKLEGDSDYVPLSIIGLAIIVFSFADIIDTSRNIIKIKTAPRVYIMEKIK